MAWSDRVAELALSVIRDPAASPEEKAAAREAAMGERLPSCGSLPPEERTVFLALLRRVWDPNLPPTTIGDLVERHVQARVTERMRGMTIADHIAAIVTLDPDGSEFREFLATLELEPDALPGS